MATLKTGKVKNSFYASSLIKTIENKPTSEKSIAIANRSGKIIEIRPLQQEPKKKSAFDVKKEKSEQFQPDWTRRQLFEEQKRSEEKRIEEKKEEEIRRQEEELQRQEELKQYEKRSIYAGIEEERKSRRSYIQHKPEIFNKKEEKRSNHTAHSIKTGTSSGSRKTFRYIPKKQNNIFIANKKGGIKDSPPNFIFASPLQTKKSQIFLKHGTKIVTVPAKLYKKIDRTQISNTFKSQVNKKIHESDSIGIHSFRLYNDAKNIYTEGKRVIYTPIKTAHLTYKTAKKVAKTIQEGVQISGIYRPLKGQQSSIKSKLINARLGSFSKNRRNRKDNDKGSNIGNKETILKSVEESIVNRLKQSDIDIGVKAVVEGVDKTKTAYKIGKDAYQVTKAGIKFTLRSSHATYKIGKATTNFASQRIKTTRIKTATSTATSPSKTLLKTLRANRRKSISKKISSFSIRSFKKIKQMAIAATGKLISGKAFLAVCGLILAIGLFTILVQVISTPTHSILSNEGVDEKYEQLINELDEKYMKKLRIWIKMDSLEDNYDGYSIDYKGDYGATFFTDYKVIQALCQVHLDRDLVFDRKEENYVRKKLYHVPTTEKEDNFNLSRRVREGDFNKKRLWRELSDSDNLFHYIGGTWVETREGSDGEVLRILHIEVVSNNYYSIRDRLGFNRVQLDWADALVRNIEEQFPERFNQNGIGIGSPGGGYQGGIKTKYTASRADVLVTEQLEGLSPERQAVVQKALYLASLNKIRYKMGAKYESGYGIPSQLDCSGFTHYVFRTAIQKSIGHGTAGQFPRSTAINASDLKPGDLGFLYRPSEVPRGKANHVGIFIGYDQNGNRMWVHCASGAGGVTIDNFNFGYLRRPNGAFPD